jgi:hypothetical protein
MVKCDSHGWSGQLCTSLIDKLVRQLEIAEYKIKELKCTFLLPTEQVLSLRRSKQPAVATGTREVVHSTNLVQLQCRHIIHIDQWDWHEPRNDEPLPNADRNKDSYKFGQRQSTIDLDQ